MARAALWLLLVLFGAGLSYALILAIPEKTGDADRRTSAPMVPGLAPGEAPTKLDADLESADKGGALQRDTPREPLSALAAPAPPAPPPDPDSLPKRWRLVHKTVASAAGILEADGLTMVLPGIDVIAVNEKCTAGSGEVWPCGMAARTAFRAYLRGRAMNCRVPDTRVERGIIAECLLQGADPALWLVSRGWARAKPDGPFGAQGEAAKQAQLGIYGSPPR